MNNITLKTRLLVKEILKPTNAKLFCNLEVNDILILEMALTKAGHSGRGNLYATNIKCTNQRIRDIHILSTTNLVNRLKFFNFVTLGS